MKHPSNHSRPRRLRLAAVVAAPLGGLSLASLSLLLGLQVGCAPTAHSSAVEHPASYAAPTGPVVSLPVAGEDELAGPAPATAPSGHDPHAHHRHQSHQAPGAGSPPPAAETPPAAGDRHEGHARPIPSPSPSPSPPSSPPPPSSSPSAQPVKQPAKPAAKPVAPAKPATPPSHQHDHKH